MLELREACVEWISLAIQKSHPAVPNAQQLAEKLLGVAEKHAITIEETVDWIRRTSEVKQKNFEKNFESFAGLLGTARTTQE